MLNHRGALLTRSVIVLRDPEMAGHWSSFSGLYASRTRVAQLSCTGILCAMARASEWSARVVSWRASGLSAEEFCKGQTFSKKSLWAWSCVLQRKAKAESRLADSKIALVRVVRAPEGAMHRGRMNLLRRSSVSAHNTLRLHVDSFFA